jgi:DNA adenine methylase
MDRMISHQAILPICASQPTPVNVSSVPQRSPFRYPGGKTWLVPHVRRWLRSLSYRPKVFYEPFLGGGIVSLTVAFENWADLVIMIERDADVAAVWKAMLSDENDHLAGMIEAFVMTSENLLSELSRVPTTNTERAFQTILKNRTSHGGILAPGSGLIKSGENGRGVLSRWYPETLARRIRSIAHFRKQLVFIEGDGLDVIRADSKVNQSAFFIDPPYTAGGKNAGKRLYKYNEIDHDELFDLAEILEGDLLMTYDNSAEVIAMARARRLETCLIPMKNTHNTVMTELLIGKNLAWVDKSAEDRCRSVA